jgi:ABC-type arginine transport system permease subunit
MTFYLTVGALYVAITGVSTLIIGAADRRAARGR